MRVTRREAFLGLGTIGAAVAAGGVVAGANAPTADEVARMSRARSSGRSTDIPAGTRVHESTLVRVLDERDGTLPIVLADRHGTEFEVEVMRFDASAPGVARAGSLAVYMNNGGNGDIATHEEHGLAAMALAAEIARREANGDAVAKLVSLRERRGAGTRTA
jgi:hypothetical protein